MVAEVKPRAEGSLYVVPPPLPMLAVAPVVLL
jgi:hypothetical protein